MRTEVLPASVDNLLRRLRDGDTQSPVTCKEVEVEEVVSALTRTIISCTAPKKRVEGGSRKRTYKSPSNHAARKRTKNAGYQDLYRRRPQRLVEWAVSDHLKESLVDTPDQRPSHAAFETFYAGVWREAGECNITMPPSVPGHTGKVLRDVTPKDIRSKI
jgi:hypothetical protein